MMKQAPTGTTVLPPDPSGADAELAEFEQEILRDALEYEAYLVRIEQMEAQNNLGEIKDVGWSKPGLFARIRAFCRKPLMLTMRWRRGRRVGP